MKTGVAAHTAQKYKRGSVFSKWSSGRYMSATSKEVLFESHTIEYKRDVYTPIPESRAKFIMTGHFWTEDLEPYQKSNKINGCKTINKQIKTFAHVD